MIVIDGESGGVVGTGCEAPRHTEIATRDKTQQYCVGCGSAKIKEILVARYSSSFVT